MTTQKNHPAAGQPDSFDRYPSYYGSDLELTYTPQRSVFTLWAPTADKVRLNLYASGEGGEPEERLEMRPSDDGTWRVAAERDLKGTFYTFQIEKEGKWLDETPGIWAKAVGVNGDRAAVIDLRETDPERLGGGPCARTENVFRHHSLRTAPPRLQRRPRFRDRKQRQIPRPDRNRHQDTPRGGVGTGPPQRAGCNAHTHPALLRLRDRGRSPTERQDLQLGIRPEELQRSGRQLLHRSGRPRGTHPGVQANGAKPAPERHAHRSRRGLQPHGLGGAFEFQPYRPRLLLPPQRRRLLFRRLRLRQRNGFGARDGAALHRRVRQILGEGVPYRRLPVRPDGHTRHRDDEPHPGGAVENRPDHLHLRRGVACGRLSPAAGKTGRAGPRRTDGGHRRFLRRLPRRRAGQHVRRTRLRIRFRKYRRTLRTREIRDRRRHAASSGGLQRTAIQLRALRSRPVPSGQLCRQPRRLHGHRQTAALRHGRPCRRGAAPDRQTDTHHPAHGAGRSTSSAPARR